MFKISNVVIRQTWQNARMCFNRKLSVTTPSLSARALNTCRLDDHSVKSPSRQSRFLSSLTPEVKDVKDADPFRLITDDMKDVYNEVIRMLRANNINPEMFDIVTSYYRGLDNQAGKTASMNILCAKVLNYHMFNDGTLKKSQKRAIAVTELCVLCGLLQDDYVDDTDIRNGHPTAHKLWPLNRLGSTITFVVGVALAESSKLQNEVARNIFLYNFLLNKAQSLLFRAPADGSDILTHYMTVQQHKFGTVGNMARNTALAVNAPDSLVDNMYKLGYNFGMLMGVADDILDIEEDVKGGFATFPTIFAMKEYPELEELIIRRFAGEGDVEKTIELVNKSQGFEETRNLTRIYHTYTMINLQLLADSPYKTAFRDLSGLFLAENKQAIDV